MSRAIVISIDSLFTSDINHIKDLPNFKKILEGSSIVKNIDCVYPTLTYPCHTSIITGVYPDKHGISHNEKLMPETNSPDWYWYSKDIRTETIIDIAKENNLKTSTILWPVTGGCNSDYNIAEIWTKTKDEDPFQVFNDSCTKELMEKIYPKHSHIIKWNTEPHLDEFGVCCAEDIIREYKPDIMFIHLAYLDHTRHKYGLMNDKVISSFEKYDEWLGRLINALDEAEVYNYTNFIILGDHGQLEVDKVVCPNIILRENNLIDLDKDGNLIDFKAIFKSAGKSAHLIIKDSDNRVEIEKIVSEMINDTVLGIERIINKEELKTQHRLDCEAEFVIEGCEGVAFSNSYVGDIVKKVDNTNYKYSLATHGHLPSKGDKPPFIAKGPDIKENTIIDGGNLVDEAPTIMKIFNIEMKDIDGKVLKILK